MCHDTEIIFVHAKRLLEEELYDAGHFVHQRHKVDALVYELYGLTGEEIGIVEAGSPGKCAGESL